MQKKLWRYLRRLRANTLEGWEMLSDGRYRKPLHPDLHPPTSRMAIPSSNPEQDRSELIEEEEAGGRQKEEWKEGEEEDKFLLDPFGLYDTEDDSETVSSSGGNSREEERKKHKDVQEPLQVYKAGCIAVRVNSKGVNQVLLITARNRESMLEGGEADAWVLPRGTVLPNETPAEAAVRETLEEAGVGGEIGGWFDMLSSFPI